MGTKIAILAAVFMLILFMPTTALQAEQPPPLPVTHQHFNSVEGPLTQESDPSVAPGTTDRNVPNPICNTPTSNAANVNTDCDGINPHDETSIAVNPNNPLNQIGSAVDNQVFLTSGGHVYATVFSRAHVTFDGGKTWAMYPINTNSYDNTSDPAVAFDAAGTAYIATLGFLFSQGGGCCTNPDVVVTHSKDGGKTWSTPTRVVAGTGTFTSVGLFNDKEYIAAWGNSNAIVTWTEFNDGIRGSYISSPIFASVTHDGGNTWSTPTEISGSAAFCIGAQGGNKCDQNQFSVPSVAANGSIYVAFENTANLTTGRDQYLVVKVDPNTGARVAGPYRVASIVDGFTDYPINIDGRQTYQDSEFRTNSAGNITADPTNSNHLAVIWSDMRNSTLPVPSDPYQATTNSDVIISQSFNGGVTWSAPVALAVSKDQFQPWGAYDASGRLRIGYYNRSYDPANHKYGYTIATETTPGSLTFSKTQLTTVLSDPTMNTRWGSRITPNPAFPHPTTFIGDYSGIATYSGGVVGLWTDMRLNVCITVRCGSSDDAFYGSTQ